MPNVHKDFHGALSFGLEFVERRYGCDGLREFLEGVAATVYKPLAEDLRACGLRALCDHWRSVFDLEGGDIELAIENDVLTLTVRRCPAIAHMIERDYRVASCFCEHTRIVNDAVCRAAGYVASVEYDRDAGCCVQRFWKATP